MLTLSYIVQPLNVLAEMAKSLTLRRLSMRGASHDQVSSIFQKTC